MSSGKKQLVCKQRWKGIERIVTLKASKALQGWKNPTALDPREKSLIQSLFKYSLRPLYQTLSEQWIQRGVKDHIMVITPPSIKSIVSDDKQVS